MKFGVTVSDDTRYPGVGAALSVLKDHIQRNQVLIESETKLALEEIFEASRDAHRTMTPSIKNHLMPMYVAAGTDTGRGVFARNVERHKDQLGSKNTIAVHYAATSAMRDHLDDMFASIPHALETGRAAAMQNIKDKILQFFDENSTAGSRLSSPRTASASKLT